MPPTGHWWGFVLAESAMARVSEHARLPWRQAAIRVRGGERKGHSCRGGGGLCMVGNQYTRVSGLQIKKAAQILEEELPWPSLYNVQCAANSYT